MSKNTAFRKLVIEVMRRYDLSGGGFSKVSGIPARTIQHIVRGDHGNFSAKNQKKFYEGIKKLEQTSVSNSCGDGFIDFSESKLPVSIRLRDIMVTFKVVEGECDAQESSSPDVSPVS